jgi:hypothetical protein
VNLVVTFCCLSATSNTYLPLSSIQARGIFLLQVYGVHLTLSKFSLCLNFLPRLSFISHYSSLFSPLLLIYSVTFPSINYSSFNHMYPKANFSIISKTVFPILKVKILNLNKEMSVTKIIAGFINSLTHISCYVWRLETPHIPVETSFKRNLLHLSHLYPKEVRRRYLPKLVNIYRHTQLHIPEDSSLHRHLSENTKRQFWGASSPFLHLPLPYTQQTPYTRMYNRLISFHCTTWRWPAFMAETCSCALHIVNSIPPNNI